MDDRFLRSLETAPSWWIVRGEGGALWSTLFKTRGVVAHGSQVERFQVDAPFEDRQRALLSLDPYGTQEVNLFHDDMDIDDVVVTPDAGGREGWFGIVTSDPFADYEVAHWIQRHCNWHPSLVPLTPAAVAAMPRGPLGTIFNANKNRDALLDSFIRSCSR